MLAIRDCISNYLAELARGGASAHTVRNYASDLEQFATYFEPPGETAPAIEQLDLALLREWLASLYDQGFEYRKRPAQIGSRARDVPVSAGRRLVSHELRKAVTNTESQAATAGRDVGREDE